MGSNPTGATELKGFKLKNMRKIVIFRKEEGIPDKIVLRAITPSAAWQGYTKAGAVIESEAKNLAQALEPSFTGYYLA